MCDGAELLQTAGGDDDAILAQEGHNGSVGRNASGHGMLWWCQRRGRRDTSSLSKNLMGAILMCKRLPAWCVTLLVPAPTRSSTWDPGWCAPPGSAWTANRKRSPLCPVAFLSRWYAANSVHGHQAAAAVAYEEEHRRHCPAERHPRLAAGAAVQRPTETRPSTAKSKSDRAGEAAVPRPRGVPGSSHRGWTRCPRSRRGH